jgi:dihydroflavonol-4-reductase
MSLLVLVTGASGFIAKHAIQKLLLTGYRVRGTVRDDAEESVAREWVRRIFASSSRSSQAATVDVSDERFSLIRADLTKDENWEEAVQDCRYVLHIASPYPLKPPRDREALVSIARGGTLRVLRAALRECSGDESTVERVVMVSSIQAAMYWENRPVPVVRITEEDWTDAEWTRVTSYGVSKTRAEKAAWEYVKERGAEERLVVVNPGMVWGPVVDGATCTTGEICRLFLTGAYPAVPPICYAIVDVRDVANLLVVAMANPDVGGRRLFCSAGNLSLREIGVILAEKFPEYRSRIPTTELPKWLVRFAAMFDLTLRHTLPDLETTAVVDCSYVTDLTGVSFRSPEEAVVATAQSLLDVGLV